MRRALAVALGALVALGLTALVLWPPRRPEAPAAAPGVALALGPRAVVADLDSPWTAVRFGTPEAERLEERGCRRRSGPGSDEAILVQARATLLVGIPEPVVGRRLALEIEPEAPGVGQAFEVALGGVTLARATLAAGRQVVEAEVPAEVQEPPRQRLRFLFPEQDSRNRKRKGGPWMARVHNLLLGPADDAAFAGVARRGFVASWRGGELLQAGPSSLRFALFLPGSGTFSASASVRPGSPGASARLRVLARDEAGERELWSRRVSAGEAPQAVQVALPGGEGEALEVRLAVDEASGDPLASWGAPRLLGKGTADPLLPRPEPESPPRPRVRGVVLVILDAARYRHCGAYGYPLATTPELDRLAREGVLFADHLTEAVFTFAAMSTIWTSQPPDAGQSEWLYQGMVPAERPTLAEVLTAAGVETAGFIANPSAGPAYDLARGFSLFRELYQRPWTTTGVTDAEIFRKALHPWIRQAHPGPFFAYAHWREPHTPYGPVFSGEDAPLPPRAKYYNWWGQVHKGQRAITPEEKDHLVRLYDGNLRWADREVGELRREMERAGLWDDTAVIVTADHGEALFEHGYFGHNLQLYEDSVRVPMVLRLPASFGAAGRRVKVTTSHLDLAPTVTELLGLGRASHRSFRGRCLLPLLEGRGESRVAVSRTIGTRPTYAVIDRPRKLLHDLETGEEKLFDLSSDPGEERDLGPSRPLLRAAYRQSLHRWLLDLRSVEAAEARAAAPDEREIEQLRALGYLQ